MTYSALAAVYSDRSVEARVWDVIAYLGRYAHQPADVCLKLTLRQLRMLVKFTSEIVAKENRPPP